MRIAFTTRKGQALFGDFILSIVIFVSLLVLIFVSFNTFENQIAIASNRIDYATFTKETSDVLFSFPGSPSNWSAANVNVVGLGEVNTNAISAGKVLSLFDIDYSTNKQNFSLGSYEFNLTFYEEDSIFYSGIAQNKVALFVTSASAAFAMVNGSNLTWDLYGANSTDLGASTAQIKRYGDKSAVLNLLIDNLTQYNTVIIENGNDVTVNDSEVVDFLNNGGTLVYTGNASNSFVSNLGASFATSQNENGQIINFSYVLRNFNYTPVFSNTFYYATFNSNNINVSGFKMIISREFNSNQCLACHWKYGAGSVYFFSQLNNSFANLTGSNMYNLVGWPATFGTSIPQDSINVFVLNTPVLIQYHNRRPIRAKLIVWSNVK